MNTPTVTNDERLAALIEEIHKASADQGGIPAGTHRLTAQFPTGYSQQWVLHLEPVGDEFDAWADPIETSDRPFNTDSIDITINVDHITFQPLVIAQHEPSKGNAGLYESPACATDRKINPILADRPTRRAVVAHHTARKDLMRSQPRTPREEATPSKRLHIPNEIATLARDTSINDADFRHRLKNLHEINGQAATLRFYTVAELAAETSAVPEWIFDGFIARQAITELDGKVTIRAPGRNPHGRAGMAQDS